MKQYGAVQSADPDLEEQAGKFARRDAKDEKILAAARELFFSLGFDATSMDLVAQRAAASKTTLYTRYPSKEALFVATLERDTDALARKFVELPVDDLPVDEALRRIGRQFMDIIWSNECIRRIQMIQAETARFPEIAQRFMQAGPGRTRAFVADYLERAVALGRLDIADPRFVADQFLATLKGIVHLELMMGLRDEPSAAEKDEFVRRATELFFKGIGLRSTQPLSDISKAEA
jgi:TetR/AcrR family transcriptional repressor of mexJK operon